MAPKTKRTAKASTAAGKQGGTRTAKKTQAATAGVSKRSNRKRTAATKPSAERTRPSLPRKAKRSMPDDPAAGRAHIGGEGEIGEEAEVDAEVEAEVEAEADPEGAEDDMTLAADLLYAATDRTATAANNAQVAAARAEASAERTTEASIRAEAAAERTENAAEHAEAAVQKLENAAALVNTAFNRSDAAAERTASSAERTWDSSELLEKVAEAVRLSAQNVQKAVQISAEHVAEAAARIEIAADRTEFSKADVLAEAQRDHAIEFDGKDSTLRVQLQVHRDPEFKSRLGYRAQMTMILPDVDKTFKVGYIDSWRIHVPPEPGLNPSYNPWISELLAVDAGTGDTNISRNRLCMQALYLENGRVKFDNSYSDNNLEVDNLIYIDYICIYEEFQKQKLVQRLYNDYCSLLKELPAWFAFSGTLLLVPRRRKGANCKWWATLDKNAAEAKLTQMFRKFGFIRCATNASVNTEAGTVDVSVLGRNINKS